MMVGTRTSSTLFFCCLSPFIVSWLSSGAPDYYVLTCILSSPTPAPPDPQPSFNIVEAKNQATDGSHLDENLRESRG